MRAFSAWALACLLLAAPVLAGDPPLRPGQSRWWTGVAPGGPMLVLVSLPEQRALVYRNGVRIGETTVSTGRPGFETPTGTFTVLEKKREHRSNLYDDAPMPFMQRLTWDGVALHAGTVPGHPASHGCVRLPADFAERLFALSTRGMTVVVVDTPTLAPLLADPRLLPLPPPPVLATGRGELGQDRLLGPGYHWAPDRAGPGPITVVLSTSDRELVVVRQGVRIGRGPVAVTGTVPAGTHAYQLLDGPAVGAPSDAAGRPRRRWLRVHGEGGHDPGALADQISVDQAFASRIYDALRPGDTLVVTDESLGGAGAQTILESEPAAGRPIEPRSGGG